MLRFAAFLTLLALSLAAHSVPRAEYNSHWERFKSLHGKKYSEAEEQKRRVIWENNVDYIAKHNLEADLGQHSYTLALNKFGDLTNKEFRQQYTGLKSNFLGHFGKHGKGQVYRPNPNAKLAASVDWRQQGYVTPVKDQGQCGSCWSFSATGAIEGQHFKSTGQLVSLSEQNLVDCSTAQGNGGCNGGLMDYAFDYVIQNGINSEADYPYEAADKTCRFNPNKIAARISSYKDITSGSESALQSAVSTVGPIAVAIDASPFSFQFYSSGVYNEGSCSSSNLDHGVLAVGYGTESGQDYWLVKNSWGTSWGDAGYIKMSRNRNNQCGIATMASYPIV